MSNSKYTKTKMHSIKRVVILALLALVATNLFCYNSGDYSTKWSGNFEDISLWECYNGLGWINATQLPSSPFANTLYIIGIPIFFYRSLIFIWCWSIRSAKLSFRLYWIIKLMHTEMTSAIL